MLFNGHDCLLLKQVIFIFIWALNREKENQETKIRINSKLSDKQQADTQGAWLTY